MAKNILQNKTKYVDGWLTDELAAARPLHACITPSGNNFYLILDFMVLLYCTQAWEMYNGSLSRKTKQVFFPLLIFIKNILENENTI